MRRRCRLGLRWPGPHSRNYHTDRDPRPLSSLSGLCVPPSAPRTEVESGEEGSRELLLREAGGPCWREHLTPPPTGKAEGSQLSTALSTAPSTAPPPGVLPRGPPVGVRRHLTVV